MGLPAIDFRFSNRADWQTGFALQRDVGRDPPWLGAPAYAGGRAYAPGSACTHDGDLYLARPDVGAGPWTSAPLFSADLLPSGLSRWLMVGRAADYASLPYDLTGCEVAVSLKACDAAGTIIDPRPKLRVGSKAGGFAITNARLGGVAWAVPKGRVRDVPGGLYRYDLHVIHGQGAGPELRERFGLVLVDEGTFP